MVTTDFTYINDDHTILSDAVLRSFFDQSNIGMAFFNADGGLVSYNDAFVEQACLPLRADDGGFRIEIFDSSIWQQLQGPMNDCMKGKPVPVQNIQWSNGRTAALTFTAVELRGRAKGVMLVSQGQPVATPDNNDAAIKQLLSQKLAELELANKEIATFSYVAGHDLQEPLRKIQTFSQLIIEKEAEHLSPVGLQYLTRMNAAAARMQKLIDDLLIFSRASTNEYAKSEVNLNDIFKKLLMNYGDTIKVKGALIHVETLPKVSGVQYQLYQLFENLLSNALKFNKPGQPPVIKVVCKIGSAFPGNKAGSSKADNQYFYEIAVTDEGIGFDQKYDQKIFQLFQRLHGKSEYTGTGLGLPVCKRIAQNHGGYISATGHLGAGATFVVLLPGVA